MKVILSSTLGINFVSYKVVTSIAELVTGAESNSPEYDNLEGVILHKTEETDTEIGLGISKLNKLGIKTMGYINCNPSIILKCSIKAIGGIVLEDEMFISDEASLDMLFNSASIGDLVATDSADRSLEIVADFVTAFMNKESRVNTEFYLRSVKNAVDELSKQTKKSESDIKTISLSAVEVFKEVSVMLTEMQKQSLELSNNLSMLGGLSAQKYTGVSIGMFPTYQYVGGAKVLCVREVSPCRFLTSFMIAYANYLKNSCNKRTKVVIVHQKSFCMSTRYSEFTRVMNSSSDDSLFNADIVVTDSPKKDVLRKLLSTGSDIVIVIDRLYGDPIVSGRVETVYAVSGESDVSKFHLNGKKVIFTYKSTPSSFLHIPYISSYGQKSEVRAGKYYQACKDSSFKSLNTLLGV